MSEGVRIKRVEFRENVGAFFPQGQSKLSGDARYTKSIYALLSRAIV